MVEGKSAIEAYIRSAPIRSRRRLQEMLVLVRKSAKGAREDIRWGMPAVSFKRILVMFAGFKNHTGFYPTPSAMKAFTKELSGYKTGKGSIQFPHDKPLPKALIKKIVEYRVRESVEKDRRWRDRK